MIYLNDKISGYILDEQQQDIVLDNSDNLLVVAGAGSGKTLTILGKIHYLVKYRNILPEEILCISFTKASADSLNRKIKEEFGYDINVYTFHKLSLEILKNYSFNYFIADSNLLQDITKQFFIEDIKKSKFHMKLLLKYFNVYDYGETEKTYMDFYDKQNIKINMLEKLIVTFLRLLKCNDYKLDDFNLFLKKAKKTLLYFKYKKEKIFLILVLNIFIKYESYLEEHNEIDFDDMIVKATTVVKEKGYSSNLKYIIIDEYQDTSLVRFNLIKNIITKTSAKLMVVGDDFQSIYRFTGCDLSLFLNFSKYFNDASIKKIENTYRNSKELIKVAGQFVMQNRKQIYKELKSKKSLHKPIKIFYYSKIKSDFSKLLLNTNELNGDKIMILGRNNNDINNVLSDNLKTLSDGTLVNKANIKLGYYMTVHKSKGLEEENVIIINLTDNKLGFPSHIEEDKVLRFVSRQKEKFSFAEERRLFYVALTRTKNNVYLFVPKKNSSIFVKELLKDYRKYIEILN